jgi:hypothetical protein
MTAHVSGELRKKIITICEGSQLRLAALQVERYLCPRPTKLERFLWLYGEVMPEATKAGRRLHQTGTLRVMSDERTPVSEALARVSEEITSAT